MKYSIVFSSMTGNTAALADRLHTLLPEESCVYFGETSREALDADADVVFVGFWTDKGSCDSKTRVFLKKLNDKTVVLFGTAGLGSVPGYFEEILKAAAADVPVSNTVIPGFMCQGKMSPEAKAKFEAYLVSNPDDAAVKKMLAEYDIAACHPNEEDFKALDAWSQAFL